MPGHPIEAARATAPADADGSASPCRSCGACCAYSRDWPRFTSESEERLARLPSALVASDESGMRCHGDRCAALLGEVGVESSCAVYADRPDVCRACEPGDAACAMARARYGLALLAADPAQGQRT